jgi:predicted  nucleic acid-binding Zn-ribbon protein
MQKIDIFVNKAKLIHNDLYNYEKSIYVNNKTKLIIKCNKCGNVFEQNPNNHLNGAGCSKCAGIKKYTLEEFINKANIIHNYKYNYDNTIYNGMNEYVIIKCPSHGIFEQKAKNHINNKQGCINCTHIVQITKEYFIEYSEKIHINKYDYSLVEINNDSNNKQKVKIICSKHGIFEQTINNHMRGQNCKQCKIIYKGEQYFKSILEYNNILYTTNKTFDDCVNKRKLLFDFYLNDYNVCVEIDGIQHFKPIKHFGGETGFIVRQFLDNIKNEYCINNEIKLIRIPCVKYTKNTISDMKENLKNNNIHVN